MKVYRYFPRRGVASIGSQGVIGKATELGLGTTGQVFIAVENSDQNTQVAVISSRLTNHVAQVILRARHNYSHKENNLSQALKDILFKPL